MRSVVNHFFHTRYTIFLECDPVVVDFVIDFSLGYARMAGWIGECIYISVIVCRISRRDGTGGGFHSCTMRLMDALAQWRNDGSQK